MQWEHSSNTSGDMIISYMYWSKDGKGDGESKNVSYIHHVNISIGGEGKTSVNNVFMVFPFKY